MKRTVVTDSVWNVDCYSRKGEHVLLHAHNNANVQVMVSERVSAVIKVDMWHIQQVSMAFTSPHSRASAAKCAGIK